MGDEGQELIKVGMEVALKPVTDIASDVLGIAGGAWLHEQHERIRRRLRDRTEEIFKERGVKEPQEPPPSVIVPLLTHAQNETREELLDLWAKLIAASMDPQRSHLYRREYVDIVKRLEPLDARALRRLPTMQGGGINQRDQMASEFKVNHGEVEVAFRNLVSLELGAPPQGQTVVSGFLLITALGTELLRVLA